jgi:DNA-binding CsgD family transcriptional regulator
LFACRTEGEGEMAAFLDQKEIFYLNQIIAELYEEKDPEASFHVFLEQLKELVFFEKGDVYFYKYEKDNLIFEDFLFLDWSDRDLNSYLDRYCSIDDVLPIVSSKQPLMFRSSDIFIAGEREKTRYYHELLSPAGMQYSIEGNLYVSDDGNVSGIGIHRSDAHEDFSQRDLEILKLSRPHLSNIAKRYQKIRMGENDYLKMIPFLSSIKDLSICIWDFDLNLLDSNLNCGNFIPPQHREELLRGLITLCRSLREKIVRSGTKDRGVEDRVRSRVNIGGQYYFADVAYSSAGHLGHKGRFVAMIYDYANIFTNILYDIRDKFSLTEREFEVLQVMMQGMSNQEIAAKLFITIPTVKKHLTGVYQKLGIEGKYQIFNAIL